MRKLSDRRWFRPLRAVLLLLVNLAAAAGVGLLILRQFQIWNELMSDPPICSNFYGDNVSCGASDTWVSYAALAAFSVIMFGSTWIERRRGWL